MLPLLGSLLFMSGCLLYSTALLAHRRTAGQAWGRSEFFWDAYVVLVLACTMVGLVLLLRFLLEAGLDGLASPQAAAAVAAFLGGAFLIRQQRRKAKRLALAETPPQPPAANDSARSTGKKRAA